MKETTPIMDRINKKYVFEYTAFMRDLRRKTTLKKNWLIVISTNLILHKDKRCGKTFWEENQLGKKKEIIN